MPNDFLVPVFAKIPRTVPNGASVEYGRLLRAIGIIRAGQEDEKPTIERLNNSLHQFKVKGNDEPCYYLDLTAEQRCSCKDADFAPSYERMCKHEIACRLVNQEPGMLSHMVDVIQREEQRKKDAAPTRRRRRPTLHAQPER